MNVQPPKMAEVLVSIMARRADRASVLKDLHEEFEAMIAEGATLREAQKWYWSQARGSLIPLLMTRASKAHQFGGHGTGGGSQTSWLDVKLGLRRLVKEPGLTIVTVFALAVGIPVGLAPWHGANAFLAPPPFEEGDRILMVKNFDAATLDWGSAGAYDYELWRDELTTFQSVAAARRGLFNVNSEDGLAEPVRGSSVTAAMFEIARVGPLMGRTLVPADEVLGAPDVVVLGHDLWQTRFGGVLDVVGTTIRVGGVQHTVVGVMPEVFQFPFRENLWLPLRVNALADQHGPGQSLMVFGRLADGTSPEQAQAELSTLGRRMALEFPDLHERFRPEAVPFTTGLFGFQKGGLKAELGFYVFQVLALLVLAVACANIGMLIFTRTQSRASELAVRTALGASRARLISQLFVEALLFAVLAAAVGLLIADVVAMRGLNWLNSALPYWTDFAVTLSTVAWAVSLAVFSAAVVGVIPAIKVTGKEVQRNIQSAAAGRSGVRFGGVSTALIIADVALAVATVGISVGLSDSLTDLSGGKNIQADQFLSARFVLPQNQQTVSSVESGEGGFVARTAQVQEELVRRIRAEPGIRSVTVASRLPGMDHRSRRMEMEGEVRGEDFEGQRVYHSTVDLNYFEAFDQPILSGRGFQQGDLEGDASVVIVNTAFVEVMLGGRNPVGRRVRRTEEDAEWHEIIGVVGSLGMSGGGVNVDVGIYHPLTPGDLHPLLLAVHVGDSPQSFIPRLRTLTSDVDPTVVVANPSVLSEIFSFDGEMVSWIKLGFAVLVGILLALSISGTYAIMSYTVTERTREIGIRLALGAQTGSIVHIIARRALMQLGVGAVLGMLLAGPLLLSFKAGGRIPTYSPILLTLIAGTAVAGVIAGVACIAPTRRALKIMPTEALRGER